MYQCQHSKSFHYSQKNGRSCFHANKDVSFTRASVPVHQIELDARNPRVQYLIKQRGEGLSQTELYELIWAKDPVKAPRG
jgi:hypothetical protein